MNDNEDCKRYLFSPVPLHGADTIFLRLKRAFEKTSTIAKSTNNFATIVCPTKSNFKSIGRKIFTDRAINMLLNGKSVLVLDRVRMNLESTRSFDKKLSSNTLLCLYADKDMLNKIDSRGNVTSIIVAPSSKEAFDYWNEKWSPEIQK
jgi:hypothetical protein